MNETLGSIRGLVIPWVAVAADPEVGFLFSGLANARVNWVALIRVMMARLVGDHRLGYYYSERSLVGLSCSSGERWTGRLSESES